MLLEVQLAGAAVEVQALVVVLRLQILPAEVPHPKRCREGLNQQARTLEAPRAQLGRTLHLRCAAGNLLVCST